MTAEKQTIRPVTRQLVEALTWDAWPSAATCVDFGIRTTEHLGALQYAYKHDGVTECNSTRHLGRDERFRNSFLKTTRIEMPFSARVGTYCHHPRIAD